MKVAKHVLVSRQEVDNERRVAMTCVCIEGSTGLPDARHSSGRVLEFKLQPHEKAFVCSVELPYCTNDTDSEWVFELHGLWDDQRDPIYIRVPPRDCATGLVPRLDRLVYKHRLRAKWPEFIAYLGQEHAILGAHSSCLTASGAVPSDGGQLFMEHDPFLHFVREHGSRFPSITPQDVRLVNEAEGVYYVSQHAVERVTHYFQSIFREVHYKTRTPYVQLVCPAPPLQPASEKTELWSGVVLTLTMEYVVVSPGDPRTKLVEHPLKLVL